MNFDIKEFLTASMILFAIIDIIGNIPLILIIREKFKIIESEKASIISLIIMITFLFLGEIILSLLGVGINEFAVAGSIIVLFIAFEMILGIRLFKDQNPKTASIIPIAFPLIAGPGTLTTLISIRSEYDKINIILAIIGSTIFYILIMLAAGMASPWQETVKYNLPTAAAFKSSFDSSWMVKVVLFSGVIGLLTSWNGFFIACTRVLFALGRGHIIDKRFSSTHKEYGTPVNAIVFSGILTALAACLGRGALIALVDVGSFCIAVAFLGVSLSFLKLRMK